MLGAYQTLRRRAAPQVGSGAFGRHGCGAPRIGGLWCWPWQRGADAVVNILRLKPPRHIPRCHAAVTAVTDCLPNDNVEDLRMALDAANIESRPSGIPCISSSSTKITSPIPTACPKASSPLASASPPAPGLPTTMYVTLWITSKFA